MYDNVGEKIKKLARVMAVIGIVAFVVIGVITMDVSVTKGLIIAATGALSSWLSSLSLYGFGDIVENVEEIRRQATISNQK